jgi:hypothetical protein
MSFTQLPIDVVINILRFDGRFRIRRGEIINKLDKSKYNDVIRFLLNKPVPCFKRNFVGLNNKCYEIILSKEIHILYNLKCNRRNEIEGIDAYLWKMYHPLNKISYC